MHIALWIVQILLALHTIIGALWKFTNTAERAAPSFAVIPDVAWIGLAVVELLCAACLALPIVDRKYQRVAGVAALVILIEMLGFTALHFLSGKDPTPIVYWLVVAGVCAFVAHGRLRRAK